MRKGQRTDNTSVERLSGTLFPVFTSEATGETFTPIFTVYRPEGWGKFELSTGAAFGWTDKSDIVQWGQHRTAPKLTLRNWGQQVASAIPEHTKDSKGTDTTENQTQFPSLQSSSRSDHWAQTTSLLERVHTASLRQNPTKATIFSPMLVPSFWIRAPSCWIHWVTGLNTRQPCGSNPSGLFGKKIFL